MYNQELIKDINEMIQDLTNKSKDIIDKSRTRQTATERIIKAVSLKVSTESEGYIVDLYSSLVTKIKADEYFKNPENLNAFYKLNLREKLNERYHFEVESIDSLSKGIDFKEINKLYTTAGAIAGTLAVGGILKFAIVESINIPIAVIIAGAVIVGITSYSSVVKMNKKTYKRAINKFLHEIENELLDWLTEVENYFDSQVRLLYKRESSF